jgi:acyl carrier protein
VSQDGSAGRDEIVEMLASFGSRQADAVPETIDSMELAWLLHQVEQRYGIRVDLDDGELAGISTVSEAVDALRNRLGRPA